MEKDEDLRAILTDVAASYTAEWQVILADQGLHYVFGGLVSSGKTTLVNGCLTNACADQGPQASWVGEMLPTDALENTTAVSMFAFEGKVAGKIIVRSEVVRVKESSHENAARFRSEADERSGIAELHTMAELQLRMPTLLQQAACTANGFKRLIVEIPFSLRVLNEESFVSGAVAREVFVDTPGLDSPGFKDHLVSVLDQKCFMFCFVVDTLSASPFGNHGFEVLQYLAQRSEMMFPPVIIFTKWEVMKEHASLASWKRANPKGLQERVRKLVSLLLDKMEAAGIPHTPFFACANALLASDLVGGTDDAEIQAAKSGLSCFVQDLVKLGRSIANPINQCRMLQLQTATTQKIINLTHRYNDADLLLEADDLDGMKAFLDGLKHRFRDDVENYFKNIKWTTHKLASFSPPAPFNRETCAINQIAADFDNIFEDFRSCNENISSKSTTVRQVVLQALERIQSKIVQNLSVYEAEAMAKFRSELWKHVGTKEDDLKKHLDFSFWQYLVGGGLGIGSLLLGQATGELVWTSMTSYIVGAGFISGAAAAGVGLVVMALWWGKDEIGGWTWQGAENASWNALMEACSKNSPKIQEFVTARFIKKVDEIIKKLEEHRIAPAASDSRAAEIHQETRRGYKDVAKRLNEVLQGKRDRWLGKPCEQLKQICEAVLLQRKPLEQKKPIVRMPLD